ncbi:hypothetical protein ACT80S_13660 [Ramlibacter sp. MAHUQ-53]|uniref:hypothetical protein n=1 Tax=unclassified Ramlibacter TaxID=2617605 RepID=UPI00362B0C7D
MKTLRPALLLAAASLLAACSSEVDKCVAAQVDAWQAEQKRLKDDIASGRKQQATGENDLTRALERLEGKVVLDTRSKDEVAAQARLKCLQAAPAPK